MLHDCMWGSPGLGLLVILLWVLILGIAVALIARLVIGSRPGPPPNTALVLLDERYARGEIEREDYLRRREDLSSARA